MNAQHDQNANAWLEPDRPAGEEPQQPNPLLIVHGALRGRYVLAIALGVILAIPGALAGYKALPPVYTSTGVITIDPTRPVILDENEVNQAMPAFGSFLQSQARMLQSPRIVQDAVRDLAEQGIWPAGNRGRAQLQQAMAVSVPRNGREIILEVTQKDPTVARKAADALLSAYEVIAINQANQEFQRTENALEALRTTYREERDYLLEQARQLAESEGTADLERRRLFMQEQIEAIDSQIQMLRVELLARGLLPNGDVDTPPDTQAQDQDQNQDQQQPPTPQPEGAPTPPTISQEQSDSALAAGDDGAADDQLPTQPIPEPELTVEDYAQIDPELNALLGQRRELERQLNALRARFTGEHRDLLLTQDELAGVQAQIDSRVQELRELGVDLRSAPVGGRASPNGVTIEQRLASLQALRKDLTAEEKRLAAKALEIQRLQDSASFQDQRYEQATRRLESLRAERRNMQVGRIRITQQANQPLSPSKDRRMPLAALGAAAGFGFSGALFVGLGLLRPRYRFIADLEEQSHSPPVLGLVPHVRDGVIEHDEAALAGIHQIRSLLESSAGAHHAQRGQVYLVTSAGPSDGKSTIATALAASMARAGRDTVLLDADLIGRGITSRLGAQSLAGLTDRVTNARDNGEVHPLEGRQNLFLMPAGLAEGFQADQLSSRAMQAVLDGLRAQFDAVVVDTGPILGSLEANAAVPHADQVVLIVSRGQNVRMVRGAVERLRRFGAGRIGLVFNRAARLDLERSTSAASLSTRSRAASRDSNQQAKLPASA